jgi:hypothetical protein
VEVRAILPGVILCAFGAAWGASLVAGFGVLWAYAATPGPSVAEAARWPEASQVNRTPGRPTLVMVVHPKCPCSRASASELRWLCDHQGSKVDTTVLFVRPAGVEALWERTDLWRDVASIPGVTALPDENGVEAARFGAVTSGHTFLYDATGRLAFSGGITPARGHEGDNVGRSAIAAILEGREPLARSTPVYGCLMTDGGRP